MEDKGHMALIGDLEHILDEAKSFAFHDFKNEQFATPKIVLVQRFEMMIDRTKNGRYDN